MKRRTKQVVAMLGAATVATLAWPGPSSAETSLGGYSGVAQAEVFRIQVYEPTIPIPSTPQVDGGIAYTKASTDTGPVSRATSSYLWPGDVIGDGFNQLVGNEKAKYPVQVNSRFPATSDSPATNTAQLTDGNGMSTSSDETTTAATVTGLGIAGPGTDLLGGLGKGLDKLPGLGSKNAKTPSLPSLPVPVSKTLAGLATIQNVTSSSSVVVGQKTLTSTSHAALSSIKLLDGLITLGAADVTSTTVSDGTKATTSGAIKLGDVKILGQDLGLSDKGVSLAGTTAKLPAVPKTVTDLLAKVGIAVQYAPSARTVSGASGSLEAIGLEISVDTVPLKTALNVGGLVAPLQDLIEKIPNLGGTLGPLLGLGPKIVFFIGDVSSQATAAPAFSGGGIPGGGGTTTGGGAVGGSGSGGTGGLGSGSLGGGGLGGGTPGTTNTLPASHSATGVSTTPVQATGFNLPGLGSIPRLMILGSLLLACAVGWALRTAGGFLLGGGRSCAYGLTTGVPDLRKG